MSNQDQRAKEQMRRDKRRETAVAWVILIGGVLLIFMLGVIFGCSIMHRVYTEQAALITTAETASTRTEMKAEADAATYSVQPVNGNVLSIKTDTAIDIPALEFDSELQSVMRDSCRKYGVPFALALAVAEKESGFNLDAKSSTNDFGIMQINAINFEWLKEKGIDPLTYAGNIEAGVLMLSKALDRYGEIELALMAYNCGDTGAKRLWDAGTYSTAYSRAVIELYEKWLGILEDQ